MRYPFKINIRKMLPILFISIRLFGSSHGENVKVDLTTNATSVHAGEPLLAKCVMPDLAPLSCEEYYFGFFINSNYIARFNMA